MVLEAVARIDEPGSTAAWQRAAMVKETLALALPIRGKALPAFQRLVGVSLAAVIVHTAGGLVIVDQLVTVAELARVTNTVRPRNCVAERLLGVGAAAEIVRYA